MVILLPSPDRTKLERLGREYLGDGDVMKAQVRRHVRERFIKDLSKYVDFPEERREKIDYMDD